MNSFLVILSVLVIIFANSCKGKSEDANEPDQIHYSVQQTLAEVNHQSLATEGFSSPVQSTTSSGQTCQLNTSRACQETDGQVSFLNCDLGSHRLESEWKEIWSSSNACLDGYFSSSSTPGDLKNVFRSTEKSTLFFSFGGYVSSDTKGAQLTNGTTIPAGAVKIASSDSFRTITMDPANSAVRRFYVGKKEAVVFDHFITPKTITVTGSRAAANRIVNGLVTSFSNSGNFTADHVFSDVKWDSASCCYPTSGSIQTTFSGQSPPATSGVLTFTTTCGEATFVANGSGSSEGVKLESCL